MESEPLDQALEDPRAKMKAALEATQDLPYNFKLPGNLKGHVARALLIRLVADHGSLALFSDWWIRKRCLAKNHHGSEMRFLCLVIQKSIAASPSFLLTEGCEIMARRILALQKAFADVEAEEHWKQPKGQASSKWKSKVRWDVAAEVDWEKVSQGADTLTGVDNEIQDRLQKKAQYQKWLSKSAEGAKPWDSD